MAVGAADLDDGMADGRIADRDLFGRHHLAGVIFLESGEHHVRRDVLVVDTEQAVVGTRRALRQRQIGDEVAVVSEPSSLLGSVELRRVEGAEPRGQRIPQAATTVAS